METSPPLVIWKNHRRRNEKETKQTALQLSPPIRCLRFELKSATSHKDSDLWDLEALQPIRGSISYRKFVYPMFCRWNNKNSWNTDADWLQWLMESKMFVSWFLVLVVMQEGSWGKEEGFPEPDRLNSGAGSVNSPGLTSLWHTASLCFGFGSTVCSCRSNTWPSSSSQQLRFYFESPSPPVVSGGSGSDFTCWSGAGILCWFTWIIVMF